MRRLRKSAPSRRRPAAGDRGPAGARRPARRRATAGQALLRRAGRTLVVLLLLGAGAGGPLWWWWSGALEQTGESLARATSDLARSASRATGLVVHEALVGGRERTDPNAVLAALDVTAGTPLLAVDLDAARARIETLPWVASASVERRLPGTLRVRLVERQPVALWQQGGELALIDRSGQVIADPLTEEFAGLMVVVGPGANLGATALLEMLATRPALAERVTSAIRVGERRWNLRLDAGIEVRLPEEAPAAAWQRLAEAEARQQILAPEVIAIDLRFPDRLIVQTGEPVEAPESRVEAAGQST